MNCSITQENRPARAERPGAAAPRGWVQPSVDIAETADAYVLEAEMPGVPKDHFEIQLDGNELTITGRRRSGPNGGTQLIYRESADRDYRRVFELAPAIDTARIQARIENGLLTLELPKSELVKPRKIPVA